LKNDPEQQLYDATLKGLFEEQAAGIVPYLLPLAQLEAIPLEVEEEAENETEEGTEVEKKAGAELNIEINRSTLKADLLYRLLYKHKHIILVIELQSRHDKGLRRRLMAYHGSLHLKYNKPVLILVIYLFEEGPEDLSYQDECEGEVFASIHPKVIRMRDLDTEQIVREQQRSLYMVLPLTKRPTVDLLKQALQEMHEHDDEQEFARHIMWFKILMDRTKTMFDEEKRIIREVLQVQYQIDPLIRENPTIMAIAAEAEAKGKAEGEIKGFQEAILAVVSNRFPTLVVSQIQQTIASSQNAGQLQKFLCQVANTSDEQEVSALLAQSFPSDEERKPCSEYEWTQELILDLVSAGFSAEVVSQVQQAIAPIQDAQQLRKFHRQLARVSDEQAVLALLAQCFPVH
jgi:hypothetical protein